MDQNREHQHPDKDQRLDIPSEANREKHINFLEVEEESAQRNNSQQVDDFAAERRKQWEEGIAEGKKASEER